MVVILECDCNTEIILECPE